VIAHQERRHTAFISKISKHTFEISLDVVEFCTRTLAERYVLRDTSLPDYVRPYFLVHFTEEIEQFRRLLKREGIRPTLSLNQLSTMLKEQAQSACKRLEFDETMYRKFMEHTHERRFDTKHSVYECLRELASELRISQRSAENLPELLGTSEE